MNWLVAKLVGSEEPDPPRPERPPEPAPQLVLRRKLVYVHSFSTTALLVLACFYTLYFLRDVLVPIAVAFVLYLLLTPVLRALERVRVPTSLASGLIVIGLVGALGATVWLLTVPVSEWAARLPYVSDEVTDKLRTLRAPMEKVAETSQQVEKIANAGGDKAAAPEVVVKEGGLAQRVYGNLVEIGVQASLVAVLLYFLLATGAIFREKLIRVMPTFGDKRRAFTITEEIQKQISRYLFTVTMINLGLGAAIGLSLWWAGMPTPLLWGAMAALLNFIPYVGALAGIGTVGIVALISYDTLSQAMAPPLIYLALTSLEGQIVTPSILGRSLTLNPLVLFVAVIIWGWLWGVPGAFLAVPFVVILKVVCDNVVPLAAIGEFLGGRRP